MHSNDPIQSWIPPQIDEASSKLSKNYQDVVIVNQAKQDGFNKGYQEGLTKAEQEYSGQLAQTKQLIFELSKIKVDLIQNAEYVLSDIAMMVAKKVIEHELTISKTQIENILREMLSKIPDMNDTIKIKVHPSDLQVVKKITTEETDKEIDISVDPALSVGSIKLKSDYTKLEYNIDKIFNSIVEKVSQ